MTNNNLIYPEESYAIRGAIYEVYRHLGNGFLEDVYQIALEHELRLRGIPFAAKPRIRVFYKDIACGDYEPDIVCYDKIIIELKAVERLHPNHFAQTMNYLKATKMKLGLLVNFCAYPNVEIRRIAL